MTFKNNISRNLPVKYGSSTYVVLCYLKMKRQPVSFGEYRKFTINKVKPSDVNRTFRVLVKYGLATQHPDGRIQINQTGADYLYKVAQRDGRSKELPNEFN